MGVRRRRRCGLAFFGLAGRSAVCGVPQCERLCRADGHHHGGTWDQRLSCALRFANGACRLNAFRVPFIFTPPANQTVGSRRNRNFQRCHGGTSPLAYQWLFNNAGISGATNSNYIVTNAQPTNVGYYSVIVTNAYGSVTSAVAALTVDGPVATLIDVAFTSASVTGKTGFAATGVTTNDFWNTYVMNSRIIDEPESSWMARSRAQD